MFDSNSQSLVRDHGLKEKYFSTNATSYKVNDDMFEDDE
jgi:hypothetical protein